MCESGGYRSLSCNGLAFVCSQTYQDIAINKEPLYLRRHCEYFTYFSPALSHHCVPTLVFTPKAMRKIRR